MVPVVETYLDMHATTQGSFDERCELVGMQQEDVAVGVRFELTLLETWSVGGARAEVLLSLACFAALFARDGGPKLVEECSYPLTGQRCVSRVYTDLATLQEVTAGCEVVTFDHEHVPTDHLHALESSLAVRPFRASSLE